MPHPAKKKNDGKDDKKQPRLPPRQSVNSVDDDDTGSEQVQSSVEQNDNSNASQSLKERKRIPSAITRSNNATLPLHSSTSRPASLDSFKDKKGKSLPRRNESINELAENAGAVPQPATTRLPGAFREGGNDDVLAAPSWSESSMGVIDPSAPAISEGKIPEDATTVTVEAQLVREEDIEHQVEERFRKRADEVADHVMERLRQTVIEAEQVEVTKEPDDSIKVKSMEKRRRRRRYQIIGGLVGIVILVAVIVVVVLVTGKDSSSKTVTTTPTGATPSAPPTKAPHVPDLHSNQSANIVELIERGSNHKLLAKYLDLYPNFDFRSNLKAENITLFAPDDESFEKFQSTAPFSYYFAETADRFWLYHFLIVMTGHMVSKSVSTAHIFEVHTLPTLIPSYSLTVDLGNKTIENGARLVDVDIRASNGYIQVPDRVLLVQPLRDTLRDYIMKESEYVFSDSITIFRKLVEVSGLEDLLLQSFQFGFSVFVPTDDAFDALNQTLLQSLLTASPNDTFVENLLKYHMLDRNVYNATAELVFFMRNNVTAWVSTNGRTLINMAQSTDAYIAQNGFVHIIDKVLLPPNIGELLEITSEATTDFNFTSFVDLVKGPARLGNLLDAKVEGYNLGNPTTSQNYLTVFAPLEGALAPIVDSINLLLQSDWLLHLQSFISNHFTLVPFPDTVGEYELTMLSGFHTTVQVWTVGNDFDFSNKTINGIPIAAVPTSIYSDMVADNGLIYVLDGVLAPPWTQLSIYDVVNLDSEFSDLALLIQSSESFASLLNNTQGPWTLLAPSNTAFAALGNRFDTSNASFVSEFLNRHVIRGNLYVPINASSVDTWNNQTLQVEMEGNNTLVGGARLLETNVLAANGVTHVIDHVLL